MVAKEIIKTYTGLRNDNLIKNNGKYAMYDKPLGMPIGLTTDVYGNEKGKPQQIHKSGLLGYTYDINGEYAKKLNEEYGRNEDTLLLYSVPNIKPTYSVNDYEGHADYTSYIGEVYNKQETYLGHVANLLGLRSSFENVALDIAPNSEGKTFADTINEILQYSDVQYAMEGDKVGIVRNIDVSKALGGVITTNVNNYSGKDTRLGIISNQMYARTLSYAAKFNSLRRTKYITPELDTLYGNNLSNVYNLSSLFLLPDGQPRIIGGVDDAFIKEYDSKTIGEYLGGLIPEYDNKQGEVQEWGSREKYFGFTKSSDSDDEVTRRFNVDLTKEPKIVSFDMTTPTTQYGFYEEGDNESGNRFEEGGDDKDSHLIGFGRENISLKGSKSKILNATNKLFKNRLVDTLVSRFHTSNDKESTLTQSAVHPIFGLSRGRNLLTGDAWENGSGKNVNGYDNPYCRVWTNHKQYSQMTDLIRPFTTTEGEFVGIEKLQEDWKVFRNYKGPERLAENSVLNKNGMINITPTSTSAIADDRQNGSVDIKHCMFSIENLAWKDVNISGKGGYRLADGNRVIDYQKTLSPEQQGPNGGRIMWFPPYDIEFQETSTADWHEDVFIGRGEPIYTYTNTKRSGSLSFTLLIDHPSVLNYWLMDKKVKEDSVKLEQQLLRYFAGCEPIAPSKEVSEAILRGDFDEGHKEIKKVAPATSITFNTYFPNNYSGVDVTEKEQVMSTLFGGQYVNTEITPEKGTLGSFASEGETLFLGYEMGLNPISSTFFEMERNPYKTLIKVMNKASADGDYKGKVFFESKTVISKEDFFKNGDNFVSYDRVRLEEDIDECRNNIDTVKKDENGVAANPDTIEKFLGDIEGKEDFITTCNNIFGETNNVSFIKTTPIYCYYNRNNDGDTLTNKTEVFEERIDAYVKYLFETMETYENLNELYVTKIPQKICRIKKDNNYEYYLSKVNLIDSIGKDFVVIFESRRDFKKSLCLFGEVQTKKGESTKSVYLYKNKKGDIKETESIESNVAKLVEDGILTSFKNEQEFRDSGKICGSIDGKYAYYTLEKIESAEQVVNKIKEELDENALDKAYEKHMYGSPKEIQNDVDYWGIQYYCVYESIIEKGNKLIIAGSYESKQAYIINECFNLVRDNKPIYEYEIKNNDGEVVKKYIVNEGTGKINNIVVYRELEVSETYTDTDADNKVDKVRCVIDATREEVYLDSNTGGEDKIDTISVYENDVEVEKYTDTDGDGNIDTLSVTPDAIEKTSVVYSLVDGEVICNSALNSSLNTTSYQLEDTNNDKKVDRIVVYDDAGNMLEAYNDINGDTKVDEIIVYNSDRTINERYITNNGMDIHKLEIYDRDGKISEWYNSFKSDEKEESFNYVSNNREYLITLEKNNKLLEIIENDDDFKVNFKFRVVDRGSNYLLTLNSDKHNEIIKSKVVKDEGNIFNVLVKGGEIFQVSDLLGMGTINLKIKQFLVKLTGESENEYGNEMTFFLNDDFNVITRIECATKERNEEGAVIEGKTVMRRRYFFENNVLTKVEFYDKDGKVERTVKNIVNGNVMKKSKEIGGTEVSFDNNFTYGSFTMGDNTYKYYDSNKDGKIEKIRIAGKDENVKEYYIDNNGDIEKVSTNDAVYGKDNVVKVGKDKNKKPYTTLDINRKVFSSVRYRWSVTKDQGGRFEGAVWRNSDLRGSKDAARYANFTVNHPEHGNFVRYFKSNKKYVDLYFNGLTFVKANYVDKRDKFVSYNNNDLNGALGYMEGDGWEGIKQTYKDYIKPIVEYLPNFKQHYNEKISEAHSECEEIFSTASKYLVDNADFINDVVKVLNEGKIDSGEQISFPKEFKGCESHLEDIKKLYNEYYGKNINRYVTSYGGELNTMKNGAVKVKTVTEKVKNMHGRGVLGKSIEEVTNDIIYDSADILAKFTEMQSKYNEIVEKISQINGEGKFGLTLKEAFDVDAIKGDDAYYAKGCIVKIEDADIAENEEDNDNGEVETQENIAVTVSEDGKEDENIDEGNDGGSGEENDGPIKFKGVTEINVESRLAYKTDKTLKQYVYPHDNSTNDAELNEASNYADLESFGLNSTYEVAKKQNSNVTCSFGEFYAAIKEGANGGPYTDFVLACEKAVLKVRENKSNEDIEVEVDKAKARIQWMANTLKDYKSGILSMTTTGDASVEGSVDTNNLLAKNRAETLVGYLNSLNLTTTQARTTTTTASAKGESNNTSSISDFDSKKDRKVTTTITFGAADAANAVPEIDESATDDAKKFNSGQTEYRRYDDERLFFSMLSSNDKLAYTNLVEKVRYFSPAFHSITPEGFNARLTFLQQCTRQGPTVTSSDVGSANSSAGNLAFGRAPFCVLRLGDFLNTKIAVRSVNITYPDSMWDLNHDGIGAQFMMAKVTMNIDIIGGSDISAPIKRLQNAVSFNYYANTSIYDNRSDIGLYNSDGTISAERTWNPTLNSTSDDE